ncbi:TPA: nucleotidyltransferase domain-containing protein [Staphylococcus aureus]
MTIPTETLDSWSKQGATKTPKILREQIEKVLTDDRSKIKRKNQIDIYLQGSYRNSTNILGSSDVDIVVQSMATFFSNISQLDTYELEIYNKTFDDATYTWKYFKNDVIETLQNAFGSLNVKVGNKSIKVITDNYEADVIPCFEYRKYLSFGNNEEEREYISGIKFYTTNENNIVINYPKKHYTFGVEKNRRVNNNYKPTIRIFKNMKKRLLEQQKITKKVTSSYFIENLLYNVPDRYFDIEDSSIRVANILEWLISNINSFSMFVCQNNQINLFGPAQEQWNEEDAREFIFEVKKFWNEW